MILKGIHLILNIILNEYSMTQLERIKEIDRLIKIRETGNAQKLADRFGVSERSIYRDLYLMKNTLKLEIRYSYELESYIYLNKQSNIF